MQRVRLILVTDPAYRGALPRVLEEVASALPDGALAVQLRDKHASVDQVRAQAWELRVLTRALGLRLVVNGYPEVAAEVDADGLHLGGVGPSVARARTIVGASRWVSCAAHDDDDVRRARDEGAQAVLVSPIFATPGKGPPRGLGALASARAIGGSRLSIFALGGVDGTNARACVDAGASGVAVIRALLAAGDAAIAARRLYRDMAS